VPSLSSVSALTRLIRAVYASRQKYFRYLDLAMDRRTWLQEPISDK
jgi:hypothetical protein